MPETYIDAYSLEKHEVMEPETAHQLSLKNELKEHNAFQCSETCSFKLALVNFGKTEFIKEPHFRSAKFDQKHSPSCSLMQKEAKARIGEKESSYFFTRNSSKITVELDLINGLLVEIADSKKTNFNASKSGKTTYSKSESIQGSHKAHKQLKKRIKSLRALIDLYEKSRQGELYDIEDKYGKPLDLKQHFQDLRRNPIISEGVIKIYVADAWVSLRGQENNRYYHLKLTNDCKIDKIVTKPTLNLNKKGAIHRGVISKEKFLQIQAFSGKKYKLYFFGSFTLKESNNHFYINLDLSTDEALDFLVFYPY
ncbi:hypothetical protein [Enterococcus sp. M190262]|uniref:hypothetical protein n=1 Tax=Enterococcus sp. M190262 TaxID=2582830 RepID=UPI0010FF9379|nr:hypothetical protein [Enterococcus sp. M190262]QCT93572.1 hypothetical protein FE005_16520 [Enterococcus sp. M190262]